MSKLIILGHTGFLGKALMTFFNKDPFFKSVIGFSSRDIDLTDSSQLSLLQKECEKDSTVIMSAAIKSDHGNSLETFQDNIRMAENIAKLSETCELKKLLLISSNAVYGVHMDHKIISENTILYPDTYYSLSKFITEKLLQLTFKGKEERLAILRPSTIYGPDENITPHTPSGFLKTYMSGGSITLWGDGSELREFVFLDDIVKIISKVIEIEFSGVMNIGGGRPRSYKDALDIISNLLDKKIEINSKTRTVKAVDKIYDLSLIKDLLPDFNFTSLEEGLKLTYQRTISLR